jgi:hypothetical protein
MIVPIPYVHCGIGLLTALTSIPLILKKVPMNRVYGVRIRKAYVSQRNWYEINAYGGKLLFAFGIFLLAYGWFSLDFVPPPTSPWTPVFLVLPLLVLVPVLAMFNAFARRLPER